MISENEEMLNASVTKDWNDSLTVKKLQYIQNTLFRL